MDGLYRCRTIRHFEDDLDFFLQHYQPISAQDVISHLHDGSVLPARSVLFTFDDGFREMYDTVAPLLRRKGAPALFFLITSAVDNRELCYRHKVSLLIEALSRHQRAATLTKASQLLPQATAPTASGVADGLRRMPYNARSLLNDLAAVLNCDFSEYLTSMQPYLTSRQVEALLQQGFAVGAHSVHHPPYAELSLQEQLDETRQSMSWLSGRFDMKCQSFAFPYRDGGVSLEFFRTIFSETALKVSFGTSGLIPHKFPYHLPRLSMEHPHLTAAEVLAAGFGRKFVRQKMLSPWKGRSGNAQRG